jgi:hypothetical protein
VLGAAAGMTLSGAALTACGLFGDDPAPTPPPDPMQPVLDEARALAAQCDRLALAQPDLAARLTPLGDDHKAHVAELTRLLQTTVAPSASALAAETAADTTVAELRAAEQKAQRTAYLTAKTAAADRAGLLGSIAACRATHVEALT